MSKKIETYRTGSAAIDIWRDAKWYWFSYRDQNRKRHRCMSPTLDGIRAKAKTISRTAATGQLIVPVSQYEDFQRWLKGRSRSKLLADVISEFMASRHGVSAIYTRMLNAELDRFMEWTGNVLIADIEPSTIERFFNHLGHGPHRRNNARRMIVTLFRFARSREYLPDRTTAPERTQRAKVVELPIRIFTPAELEAILAVVSEKWLPWVVIGAFAGLRTGETARLDWSMVKWSQKIIDLPAGATKTSRRRLVPLRANLAAWLSPWRHATGRVVPGEEVQRETERIAAALKTPWKVNALRHSYGTYRAAETQNLAQLAYEMGNSVSIIRRHYDAVARKKDARLWFGINPATAKNVIRLRA